MSAEIGIVSKKQKPVQFPPASVHTAFSAIRFSVYCVTALIKTIVV